MSNGTVSKSKDFAALHPRLPPSRIWPSLLIAFLLQLSACLAIDTGIYNALSPPDYNVKLDHGSKGSYPTLNFLTSKLKAPRTNFRTWSPECAGSQDDPSYYFLTPKGWRVESPGPMILDARGDMIWTQHFENKFGGQAYDLMVQEYQGEKVLTFWLGDDRIRGHGAGHFYMLNESYEVVRKIGAANGRFADLHEFLITPQGTALIVVFEVVQFDVRPAGRRFNDLWNQFIWDCLIQEIDIATGEAVFEWRASEHLDIRSSYKKLLDLSQGTSQSPYDPWHFNSVEKDEFGNYLVSARYTHAAYYISGATKEVIWTLGGKNNSFADVSGGQALNFAWAHNARWIPVTTFPKSYNAPPAKRGSVTRLMTLFDNAAEDWNYDYGPPYARGMLLELTYPTSSPQLQARQAPQENSISSRNTHETLSKADKAKLDSINGADLSFTARLIQQYVNPNKHQRSSSQGSMQVLPPRQAGKDPNILVGYGINAVVSEFSSTGNLVCDLHFGAETGWEKGDVQSYRALKYAGWVGRPRNLPSVVEKGGTVYVSWNGATEVGEWLLQVSATGEPSDFQDAEKVTKKGFETGIELPRAQRKARYVRVVAVDKYGHILEHGTSEVLRRGYFGTTKVGERGLSIFVRMLLFVCGVAGVLVTARVLLRRFRKQKAQRWKLP